MAEPISREQALAEGYDLHNLTQHPGWKVIVDEAEQKINVALTNLVKVDASKVDEVMELQHHIKALRWLIDWPVTMAAQAQAIEKEAALEAEPAS
jgi:hypothetical protein